MAESGTISLMSPGWNRVRHLVLGTVVLAWGSAKVYGEPGPADCHQDHRCGAIRNFFLRYKSPLAPHAGHFVAVADKNKLDWRLLPSIAMVETSGGKHATKYTIFGWNSGRAQFHSVTASIEFVSSRFAKSAIYSGRSAMGILQRYNPDRVRYPQRVTRFMLELSAEPVE